MAEGEKVVPASSLLEMAGVEGFEPSRRGFGIRPAQPTLTPVVDGEGVEPPQLSLLGVAGIERFGGASLVPTAARFVVVGRRVATRLPPPPRERRRALTESSTASSDPCSTARKTSPRGRGAHPCLLVSSLSSLGVRNERALLRDGEEGPELPTSSARLHGSLLAEPETRRIGGIGVAQDVVHGENLATAPRGCQDERCNRDTPPPSLGRRRASLTIG